MQTLSLTHSMGRITTLLVTLMACTLMQCSNVDFTPRAALPISHSDTTQAAALPFATYDSALLHVSNARSAWSKQLANAPSAKQDEVLMLAGHALHNLLADTIFPYWYGTTWDFNGYTNVP